MRLLAVASIIVVTLLPVMDAIRHDHDAPGSVVGRTVSAAGAMTSWCVTGMESTPVMATSFGFIRERGVAPSQGAEAGADGGCRRTMSWPLRRVVRLKAFDPPERPWLAGHRGIDLAAAEHDELVAPADGVVSFAGTVAGKQVVSIRHDGLTLTFEPAVTRLSVGTRTVRDELFGEVGARSDHCDGTCLHWGVRRGGEYLDPETLVGLRRIALKPVE